MMWKQIISKLKIVCNTSVFYLDRNDPKGYIVANKVTFEVKDTGDVQGAKMEDEQAMGKVILNKTDKDTKKPMKGVEFQ